MRSLKTRVEQFKGTQLNARDFDGTEALTMHPSPNQMDVPRAYTIAVDALFGPRGLKQYTTDGGLNNRNPREVVASLANGAPAEQIESLTRQLIDMKLGVLTSEIGRHSSGQVWPELSDGFADFKIGLQAAKEAGVAVDDAVVSSGHTGFIQRVYDFWGLPEPDIFVTTETTQEHIPPFTAEELTKPACGLITLTHLLWQRRYGLEGIAMSASEAARMVGAGDDPIKDGRLFQDSGVMRFHLVTPETAADVWAAVGDDLGISQFVSGATYV